MAELGIIAAVTQIADVGLRLSIKLYTFGEIVASADRSVISISKDVSLTSVVLKELGQILEKDRKSRTFSENAVQTADGVVKECMEVFQEMDSILVKKLPSLGAGRNEEKRRERPKRAMLMLEKLKWGYLQPKLQLLRSNLDRLKSTLLLMLNVITYAKQVSEKTELPSVIAEQRSLIEDLAHSNQEYIRNFENLRLGIGGDAMEDAQTIPKAGAVGVELSTKKEPVLPAPKRKIDSMNFATLRTPLKDEEKIRGVGSNEPTTATSLSPSARIGLTELLAFPPNAPNIAMPPLQVQGQPTTEAPLGFDQEVLFKQLRYFSMLIQDLLKEVDEPQYKITFQSRLRMKGGIAGLHEGERRELEKMWGCTALQTAEQRLDSLVEEFGDLPTMRRSAPSANDSSWFHSAATSPNEDSFAGNAHKRPSPQLTNSFDSFPPEYLRSTEIAPRSGAKGRTPRGRPRRRGAKAKKLVYVKPHQQYSTREWRADMPFQPSTSARLRTPASSVASIHRLACEQSEADLKQDTSQAVSDNDFQQEPDPALSTGGKVTTPTNYINVHSSQLMQFNGYEESPSERDLSNPDLFDDYDEQQCMQEDDDFAYDRNIAYDRLEGAGNDMRQKKLPGSNYSGYDTSGDEHLAGKPPLSLDMESASIEPGRTPDAFERESKQVVSQLADMELVDHLVSLWTTLKL